MLDGVQLGCASHAVLRIEGTTPAVHHWAVSQRSVSDPHPRYGRRQNPNALTCSLYSRHIAAAPGHELRVVSPLHPRGERVRVRGASSLATWLRFHQDPIITNALFWWRSEESRSSAPLQSANAGPVSRRRVYPGRQNPASPQIFIQVGPFGPRPIRQAWTASLTLVPASPSPAASVFEMPPIRPSWDNLGYIWDNLGYRCPPATSGCSTSLAWPRSSAVIPDRPNLPGRAGESRQSGRGTDRGTRYS